MKNASISKPRIAYSARFVRQKPDGTTEVAALEICARTLSYTDSDHRLFDVRLGQWDGTRSQAAQDGVSANGGYGYHMPAIGKDVRAAAQICAAVQNRLSSEKWAFIGASGANNIAAWQGQNLSRSLSWGHLIEAYRLAQPVPR